MPVEKNKVELMCPICNKGEMIKGKVLMCSEIKCNQIFISGELYEKLRKVYWKLKK